MAFFLRDQGYDAWALKGGYQRWRDLGYPREPKEVEAARDLTEVCDQCGHPMAAHVH